jgi:Flp pilus assembly protein TadG
MIDGQKHSTRKTVFARFARSEDGGMIALGLIFFTLMVMMGGLAVDLMRYEAVRTQLQQTSDRAALAAASLRQKRTPASVVEDYFAKAGLSEYLQSVTPLVTLNAKSVDIVARAEVHPFFMPMLGIDEMTAPANSGAMERITDVEISLVLDISGSMENNNRMENIQTAAGAFVADVINNNEANRTTVSIIPYSGHVNLGADLASKFNITSTHSDSYCVDLPSTAFSSIHVARTTPLVQASHFDPYSGTSTRTASRWFCPTGGNTILPLSDSVEDLQGRINAMVPTENTSIDLGVKWGAALLSPQVQGIVSGTHANRPFDPAVREVLKVLVVMTDGDNTTQHIMNTAYKGTGLSNIWRDNSTGALAAYINRSSTSNDYYWKTGSTTWGWTANPFDKTTGTTRLTWDQVWQYATLNFVADRLYAKARESAGFTSNITSSYWTGQFRSTSGTSTKNTRLQSICTAAKNAGITIFGISFEAGTAGQTQIRNCSTLGNFHNVVGAPELSSAFTAIASQINHLRLTQ